MTQYEVIEWFTKRYLEDENEYYTARVVAKEFSIGYLPMQVKIKKLFLYGYLVTRYQPLRKGRYMYQDAGFQYKLNPAKAQTMISLLKLSNQMLESSNNPKQKIPNVLTKGKKKECQGGANGDY
jgi:hypothetical protein